MKKYLSAVLILCLLFAGVTRAENKTPSANHGSVATEFGGFVVPLPDYYEYADEMQEFRIYLSYDSKGAIGSMILFKYADITQIDGYEMMNGIMFEIAKTELLDTVAKTFFSNSERVSTTALTVPDLHAAMGNYKEGGTAFSVAIIYDEPGKEMLFLCSFVSATASYSRYSADLKEMLEGITLKGAVPSPKITVTNGVSREVKAFWDEYEAFVDEYIGFMEDYAKNPYDLSLLTKLYDYIGRLTELEKKGDAYTDSKQYSGADLAYSLEVSARVLKKLSGAIGDVYGSLF